MSAPLFSIGGIASGLPPDLVQQLMAVERLPVQRLENRQARIQVTSDAWKQVNTRLSALRGAVDAVRRPTSFSSLRTVSSSNESAVTVAKTGSPAEGSLSFTVSRLATAMQRSVGDTFSGLDEALGGRTLTIIVGGQSADVTPTSPDATLADLIDHINAQDLGIRATTLQVTPGAHRIVLTAESAGADAAFTVAGMGWVKDSDGSAIDWADDNESLIADGVNARLTIGSGAQAIVVERPSNTITDLYDGMTVTLGAETAGPVTIAAQKDIDGAVKAVKNVIDTMNGTISTLTELSRYDAETNKAAPLQGDATVRTLLRELRTSLSAMVDADAGRFGYAGGVGISLTRDGTFTLDQGKLRAAFSEDFAATAKLFARSGTSTDPAVTYLSHNGNTATGEITVAVTKRAVVTNLTGAIAVPPATEQTYRITTASGPVTVTLPMEATVTQAVNEINIALDAAGSTVTASDSGGDVALEETVAGSRRTITVERQETEGTWTTTGTGDGEDATADITFDGVTTTYAGGGDRISVDDGPLSGLRLMLDGPVGASARITVSHGIGGVLDQALSRAEGVEGSIKRAQNLADNNIDRLQEQIERYEIRLELREVALRRKFSAMESAMAGLASQGNWLSAQLPGLMAASPRNNQ